MITNLRVWLLFLVGLLALAACGGRAATGTVGGIGAGNSVHLLFDTATGADGLVRFEVAAASFEPAVGAPTANVLRTPATVTFSDPTGELSGLRLDDVPAGDYLRLHLLLVPASGRVLYADGQQRDLVSAVDLVVPIAEGLQHRDVGPSWLAIGHNRSDTLVGAGSTMTWQPDLRGRAAGAELEFRDLEPTLVAGGQLQAAVPAADDARLQVAFTAGCTFGDDLSNTYSTRSQFLSGLSADDDLHVRGELGRDGRLLVKHARRGRGNGGPRLLGRITALQPAVSSFVLRVQAEVRRGVRSVLDTPVDVVVRVAQARLERPDDERLFFADLAVGQLAKVKWTSRTVVAGGLDVVVARSVEITAGAGVALRPEWEGLVQSVDLATGVVVVVPAPGEAIVVRGLSVASVLVVVDTDTVLQRRTADGRILGIDLSGVVAGSDRIVWRGTVVTPTAAVASGLRVRAG